MFTPRKWKKRLGMGAVLTFLVFCPFSLGPYLVENHFHVFFNRLPDLRPVLALADSTMPFQPGERLVFQARWEFIPAGEAILEVLPIEELDGRLVRRFALTVFTYRPIDIFYKVRDRIDTYTDLDFTHTVFFTKVKDGKSKADEKVFFDWQAGTVQYTNFGEKREPVEIQPGTFDPFTIFYAFRLQELEEGIELTHPVTDGKKLILGRATIIRRETIECAMGTMDAFLVEPAMEQIGGAFEKSKGAKIQIWVSADRYRIPLRIKSKVWVGSFVAELIQISGTDWPLQPPSGERAEARNIPSP